MQCITVGQCMDCRELLLPLISASISMCKTTPLLFFMISCYNQDITPPLCPPMGLFRNQVDSFPIDFHLCSHPGLSVQQVAQAAANAQLVLQGNKENFQKVSKSNVHLYTHTDLVLLILWICHGNNLNHRVTLLTQICI